MRMIRSYRKWPADRVRKLHNAGMTGISRETGQHYQASAIKGVIYADLDGVIEKFKAAKLYDEFMTGQTIDQLRLFD